MSDIAAAARAFVQAEHGDVLAAVDECADAVAATWRGESTSEASAVADPLRVCLRERGVVDALPRVLAGAVRATGHELAAPPVAGPPYVVVTSRGPICRATLPGSGRLVLRFRAFEVTGANRYVRGARGEAMLDVELVSA